MEHMMARLLAEIRTNREKMRAGQELLKEEMVAMLDAHHERMMARMDSSLDKMEAEVDVFEESLNKTGIMDLEANREKSENVAGQQNASEEDAAVETIGALLDRYGVLHLAVGHRRQRKKRTRAMVGPRRSWPTTADG
jgi:hypothetical protein